MKWRSLPAVALLLGAVGLVLATTSDHRALSSVSASSVDPDACLGIDADGDGAIDELPSPGSGCIVVPFIVEPTKNQTVDLEFKTVHAAFPRTDTFDPGTVLDSSLHFGDADTPSNRAHPPVTNRCKFGEINGDGKADKICKWSTPKTGIQAGDTSACVTGLTTDNTKIEACAPMSTLQSPSPSPSPSPTSTSTDTPSPTPTPTSPPARISISDLRLQEGNSGWVVAILVVTLEAPSTSTVTVDFATADGTASAGSDYEAASGTLTFEPGEVSKTVGVAVLGDTVVEPHEDLYVNLSNPVAASIFDGQGRIIVRNDD